MVCPFFYYSFWAHNAPNVCQTLNSMPMVRCSGVYLYDNIRDMPYSDVL